MDIRPGLTEIRGQLPTLQTSSQQPRRYPLDPLNRKSCQISTATKEHLILARERKIS